MSRRLLSVDQGVGESKTVVTVILGAEKYAPIQYQSFDVGPYMVQVEAAPGETIEAVYARVMPILQAQRDADFKKELVGYLDRVRQAAQAAKGGRS